MTFNLLRGYVLLVVSLVVLTAAAVLLATNLGDTWTMHVFFKDVPMRRAAWLLLAGAGGLVVWWTLTRLLPRAVADIRQAGRRSGGGGETSAQSK